MPSKRNKNFDFDVNLYMPPFYLFAKNKHGQTISQEILNEQVSFSSVVVVESKPAHITLVE